MAPPNIVLICADDIGFNEIGCYQGRGMPDRDVYDGARVHTPHIDALARDGARFDRHYTPSAICTPARYCLLTGRHASRSASILERFPPPGPATITWNTHIEPGDGSIGTVMQRLGYRTGYVGKWHNGNPNPDLSTIAGIADPDDPRFANAVRDAYDSQVDYLRDGFGFDSVERVCFGNREGWPVPLQVHNLEWLCEASEHFINDNRERPFFLYLAFSTPHGDYCNDPLGADPSLTPRGRLNALPQTLMPDRADMPERLRAAGVDRKTAMSTWQDDCVGAIVARLERLGLSDNTVVIFTGDHLARGKNMCYEGCRVPFLIRWPGRIPAGTLVDALTAHTDLAATLAGLAGGTPPAGYRHDGVDFSPLLTDDDGARAHCREQVLLECSNIRAVVTQRYKYIACRADADVHAAIDSDRRAAIAERRPRLVGWEGAANPHPQAATEGIRFFDCGRFAHYHDADQLYDLDDDVFETRNLADDPAYADVLADLRQRLGAELDQLPHAFGEFSAGHAPA